MNVRGEVLAQIMWVASEHGKRLTRLGDDLLLVDSGIDALCLEVICNRLEARLGTDIFTGDEDTPVPVTVGGFIKLWERAPIAALRLTSPSY